jgi:hypothetical protein
MGAQPFTVHVEAVNNKESNTATPKLLQDRCDWHDRRQKEQRDCRRYRCRSRR